MQRKQNNFGVKWKKKKKKKTQKEHNKKIRKDKYYEKNYKDSKVLRQTQTKQHLRKYEIRKY